MDDSLGGTVVLFQLHHLRVRVVSLEMKDIFDVRPTPTIDSLPVITDHRDILGVARKHFDNLVLDFVGVLILVDHDIGKTTMKIREHFRKFQELVDFEEDIVEIERIHRPHSDFQLGVDIRRGRGNVRLRDASHSARIDSVVLGTRNHRDHLLDGNFLLVDLLLREDNLDKSNFVILIKNHEILGIPEPIYEQSQKIHPHRVKRSYKRCSTLTERIDLGIFDTELLSYSFAHLSRCLVGESNAEDGFGQNPDIEDEIRDPFGQGMGFSGTGTSQYEKRSINVIHRFLLSFVEHGGSIPKSERIASDFYENTIKKNPHLFKVWIFNRFDIFTLFP